MGHFDFSNQPVVIMFSKSIQVLRLAPRLPNTPNAFRKLSSANALQNSAGASDPIQKLFADKVTDYSEKAKATGGLVDATAQVQANLKEELEKVSQTYGGGKGVDMTAFPIFRFKDPKLDTKDLIDSAGLSTQGSSEIDQVKAQVVSLEEEISQLNSEREELLAEIDAATSDANTNIESLTAEKDSLAADLESLGAKLGTVEDAKKLLEQELEEKVKLVTDSKATSDLKIQELQEQLAASESSLKESAAKSLELENKHTSLISDLKAKESENASIQADQEKKAQEIQTLSQAIGTVNNQLAAKVRLYRNSGLFW